MGDRTVEFENCCEVLRASRPPVPRRVKRSATDSIGYSAKELAKGVRGTAKLISQLGELARRKALFNDPSAEINELTGVVKRHLGAQKQQLAQLAQQMGARAGRARTAHERGHWSQVVEMLKQQIVRNATDFQAALRVRTRTIKELAARRGRFSSSKFAPPPPMATPLFARPVHRPALGERESDGSGGGRSIGVGSGGPPPTSAFGARQGPPVGVAPPSTARPGPGVDDSRGAQPSGGLRHRGGAADASAEQPSLYSGAGPGFGSGQIVGFEQARSRASEAQQVESTIVELGQMSVQLGELIAGQQETVERIDENVSTALDNVQLGQAELLKYLQSVSSNRGLILKIFAVLVVIILIFRYL